MSMKHTWLTVRSFASQSDMAVDDIELRSRGFERLHHRLLARFAAGDKLHAVARRLFDRRQQRGAHRHDDFLDKSAEQKSLDDVLNDRFSRERLELLRDRSTETGARTRCGDDDQDRHKD